MNGHRLKPIIKTDKICGQIGISLCGHKYFDPFSLEDVFEHNEYNEGNSELCCGTVLLQEIIFKELLSFCKKNAI